MSSNLVKQMFTVVSTEDKRVIDTSTLIQQRLEEYNQQQREKESKGFVAGLRAEEVVLPDDEESGMEQMDGEVLLEHAGQEAKRILEQAREEADSIVAQAQAKALQMCEDAKTQAEVEKNKVISEARQAGYNEGLNQARMEGEAARQEFLRKEKEVEAFYQQQIDVLEPQLVDVITGIYEHIFHVELRSYREILTFLISSTLRKIDGSHDFIIHVSKEDYPYVNMQKKQIVAGAVSSNCNVEILEDIALSKNDCLIETENGIFDCGLGTQMSELKQKIKLLSWVKEE